MSIWELLYRDVALAVEVVAFVAFLVGFHFESPRAGVAAFALAGAVYAWARRRWPGGPRELELAGVCRALGAGAALDATLDMALAAVAASVPPSKRDGLLERVRAQPQIDHALGGWSRRAIVSRYLLKLAGWFSAQGRHGAVYRFEVYPLSACAIASPLIGLGVMLFHGRFHGLRDRFIALPTAAIIVTMFLGAWLFGILLTIILRRRAAAGSPDAYRLGALAVALYRHALASAGGTPPERSYVDALIGELPAPDRQTEVQRAMSLARALLSRGDTAPGTVDAAQDIADDFFERAGDLLSAPARTVGVLSTFPLVTLYYPILFGGLFLIPVLYVTEVLASASR